jgi:hypothetical protein
MGKDKGKNTVDPAIQLQMDMEEAKPVVGTEITEEQIMEINKNATAAKLGDKSPS